jgi:uncharacterized protein YigE (DUF2233 family)
MSVKFTKRTFQVFLFVLLGVFCSSFHVSDHQGFVYILVDLEEQNLGLFWKGKDGKVLGNFEALEKELKGENQHLLFAMNAGMYTQDQAPLGLYIEKGKTLHPLNTQEGNGNFYLKPNGVFSIDRRKEANLCTTAEFVPNKDVVFATQSGPMLLVEGQYHPAFKAGSTNLNIRNGVGLINKHKVVLAMSKEAVNFYDFARFFKSMGCENALYLDGFVSRTYYPKEKWMQKDGAFGVMLGVY